MRDNREGGRMQVEWPMKKRKTLVKTWSHETCFFFLFVCFRAAPTLRNTVGARHSSLCGSYDNLKKGVGRSHRITSLLLPYVFIGKIKTVLNEWRRYSSTPYKKMVAHPRWIYSLVSPEGIFHLSINIYEKGGSSFFFFQVFIIFISFSHLSSSLTRW